MTLCAQGVPITEVYLFYWGDTLMVDFPCMAGKMCDWTVVETVEGAREVLAVLSQKARIYVATGAADSTESEIKRASNPDDTDDQFWRFPALYSLSMGSLRYIKPPSRES